MGEGVTDPTEDLARSIVELERKVQDIANALITQSYMPGDLIYSYANTRPGSLPCDGSGPYLCTDYPALGAILSVNAIDFLTPDHRGRVAIGTGTGSGLTLRAKGTTYGLESVTLTGAQSGIASHFHTVAAATGSTTPGGGTTAATDPGDTNSTTPAATGSTTPGASGAAGSHAHTYLPNGPGLNPSGLAGGGVNGYLWGNSGTATDTVAAHTHTAAAHTHTSAAHTHTMNTHTHTYTGVAHTHTLPNTDLVAAANASASHENLQPSIGVNVFIKT